MKQYECIYILKPNLEEEARAALIEKFSGIVTDNGGEIVKIDEWGNKKLAYAINYIEDGYYVLMYFKSSANINPELERNFKISEDVMRYMVVVDQNA